MRNRTWLATIAASALALPPAGQALAASCGPSSLCASTPYYGGCGQPTLADKSIVRVKDRDPDDADRFSWKWRRGSATAKAEMGTPLSTTDYEVCVYDGETLVANACAPAGASCGGSDCWRETRKGFRFLERKLTGSGLQIVLREGIEGKAKITIKASGAPSIMPPLPAGGPAVVRLVHADGSCWESSFSAPSNRNEANDFKDRSDPPKQSEPSDPLAPIVSAHRGGAAYAPENTMVAYRNAARLGVDDFETDSQLSSDGVLVVIHDDTLDRTTDCTGGVITKTYAELQACDAAYWFSPGQPTTSPDTGLPHPLRGQGVTIPTPAELFAYAKDLGPNGPTITIEIKNIPGELNFDPDCNAAADALVAEIQASGIQERIIVQSFWPACVDNVKALDPTIRTLFLTASSFGQTAYQNLAYCTSNGHEISAPNFDAPDFDGDFVDAAHTAGKLVVPYTADSQAEIELLTGFGTDGIITNFPACQLALQGRSVPESVLTPDAGSDPTLEICGP